MTKRVANETLYTIPELEAMLGISDRTLRQYFRTGRFKGVKLAGRWHITETALRQYLAGDASVKSPLRKSGR